MKKIISLVVLCLAMACAVPPGAAETRARPEQEKTLRFYLVRHGQTYSNIKEMTIGGGGNAQLTPKGRYDASCLGLGLADVSFIAGYSSTLGRAYETANQILRGRNITVKQIDDLKDISWGDAEGGRIESLTRKFGHSGNDFPYYFGSYDDPGFTSPVNAENMYHFGQRFEKALRHIAGEHQGETGNILVTAHSSMAFYLQKYRGNQPLAGLSNTSVSVLELKGGKFTLIDFNDTSYLNAGYDKAKHLPPLEITVVVNPLTILQRAGVMEGTTDSDFTPQGVKANDRLAALLQQKNFTAAYSSELGRGYKTAGRVLAGRAVPLTKDARLNEIFLGHWEAENIADIRESPAPAARDLFNAGKVIRFVSPDDGESGEIAAYRLDSLLSSLGQQYEFDRNGIVVFTHPLILTAFFNKRLPDYAWQPGKGAQVMTLQYKDENFRVKDISEITP